MHTTSKDPPMETKSAKEIVFYFFCSWFSQIQKFPAEGPEILSQKRWSKSYAWKWISETVLKSWRRLPEMMIFFVFELPVLPTSGIFGVPGSFPNSWTWFSDFPGEAELRIAKISIFWSPKCHFFMLFFDHFWVIFWSLKTALSSILGP